MLPFYRKKSRKGESIGGSGQRVYQVGNGREIKWDWTKQEESPSRVKAILFSSLGCSKLDEMNRLPPPLASLPLFHFGSGLVRPSGGLCGLFFPTNIYRKRKSEHGQRRIPNLWPLSQDWPFVIQTLYILGTLKGKRGPEGQTTSRVILKAKPPSFLQRDIQGREKASEVKAPLSSWCPF